MDRISDRALAQSTVQEKRKKFVTRLWDMVNSDQICPYLSWQLGNDGFFVNDVYEFRSYVVSRLGIQYESFVSQLYNWGFQTGVSQNTNKLADSFAWENEDPDAEETIVDQLDETDSKHPKVEYYHHRKYLFTKHDALKNFQLLRSIKYKEEVGSKKSKVEKEYVPPTTPPIIDVPTADAPYYEDAKKMAFTDKHSREETNAMASQHTFGQQNVTMQLSKQKDSSLYAPTSQQDQLRAFPSANQQSSLLMSSTGAHEYHTENRSSSYSKPNHQESSFSFASQQKKTHGDSNSPENHSHSTATPSLRNQSAASSSGGNHSNGLNSQRNTSDHNENQHDGVIPMIIDQNGTTPEENKHQRVDKIKEESQQGGEMSVESHTLEQHQ